MSEIQGGGGFGAGEPEISGPWRTWITGKMKSRKKGHIHVLEFNMIMSCRILAHRSSTRVPIIVGT